MIRLTRFVAVAVAAMALQASSSVADTVYPQATENVGDPVPAAPAKITPSDKASSVPHVPQAILLDEFTGKFITNPTGGAGGAAISQLHSGMNTLGFGHQVLNSNRVSDDFTVPAPGWILQQITFYAYQTGSSTTSTINNVRLVIRDAQPPGGSIVFGDLVTNRLAMSTWSGAYRVSSTTPLDTARPVMANVVTINPPLQLNPGTYWMIWTMGGTLASGPWAPPITITGTTTTGNGLQELTGSGTYNPALDGITATQQGFPFIIEGTILPVELQSFRVE